MSQTKQVTRTVCSVCRGQDVSVDAWLDVNTERPQQGDGPIGSCYCHDCGSHVTVAMCIVDVPVCEPCSLAAWGTDRPTGGVVIVKHGHVSHIEKCPDCDVYADDESAAKALCATADRLGLVSKLAFTIVGDFTL